MSPRNQHHPTPEERDERVKLDLDPEEAIKLIMETGEGDDTQDKARRSPDRGDRR